MAMHRTLVLALLAATTLLGALWLDRDPGAFVYLYPLAAGLGVIGIWQFSRIRVRGEGRRRSRHVDAGGGADDAAARGDGEDFVI